MGESTTVYVGLDVHKEIIDIGLCDAGQGCEMRHLATVAGGCEAVTKVLRPVSAQGSESRRTLAWQLVPKQLGHAGCNPLSQEGLGPLTDFQPGVPPLQGQLLREAEPAAGCSPGPG